MFRSLVLVTVAALTVLVNCHRAERVSADGGVDEDAGGDSGSADRPSDPGPADIGPDAGVDSGVDAGTDAGSDPGSDGGDNFVPEDCGFGYQNMFTYALPGRIDAGPRWRPALPESDTIDRIAHVEPAPSGTFLLPLSPSRAPGRDLVMPEYEDNMPLFERAEAWQEDTRCFETPRGVAFLTEEEAYHLYRKAAELTTGVTMDTRPGVRSVVGLRGAYPGTFAWHGNLPDRFNDTLVLLWIDSDGAPRVREFPINTDTGAHDFGWHASSSLRPNRRYRYINGWHRLYNALHIAEDGYRVRDDANKNGHWDSDRNGWLPPDTDDDHDRTGGGHNIHMGSLDAPLGSAAVDVWSAGCQVIPGMANWTAFITSAWTSEGNPVDYFLLDVRDIPHSVWESCTPDGTHACPFVIPGFPYTHTADTSQVNTCVFDRYNCSAADESGPEVVYVFTTDRSGTLSVSVDCIEPVDIDIHLLDGDDPDACLERAHIFFSYDLTPGRYFILADTYVDTDQVLSGPYTLHVDLQ